MNMSKPLIAAVVCISLTACEQGHEKQTVGTLAGPVWAP